MERREPYHPDDEKIRAAIEYEAFTRWFEHRHGCSIHEVVESTKWVRTHRDWVEAMKKGGSLALIGFFASGLLLALWEGLKLLVRRG